MKIITITWQHNISKAAAILLLVASDHFPVSAQPVVQNDGHVARPVFYFVEGEVNVPQRYVYTNGLTLALAIKRAKGLTAEASPTKVSLTRTGQKPIILDYKAIEQGKAKDPELKPCDKIWVPRK
jgi:protein involved in polysaccharide export with SLBB domain